MTKALLLTAAALIAVIAVPSGVAHAQSVSDFYKGKTITVVIGHSAGSAYDVHARMLAKHMPKHIPGNPVMIPQNMPGAGSLRGAQYVAQVAPKDGTVIGSMSRSLPVEPLLGEGKFDGRGFTWIGNISVNNSLCATWHTTPVKTWDDLFSSKQIVLGGEGPGSDIDNFALILRNVFNVNVRIVSGYPGGNEVNLAIERGELDGRCGWSWSAIKSTKPEWLRDKKINLLVAFASDRAKDLPAEIPMATSKVKNDEQRRILEMHIAAQAFGWPFFAAQGIPEDRKQALRNAFDQTMKDPAFIEEMTKARLEINPVTGAELERTLDAIYANPPEIVAKAKDAIRR